MSCFADASSTRFSAPFFNCAAAAALPVLERVLAHIDAQLLAPAAGNPWLSRFAEQAHGIPYASDRIVLWDDHALILRSHGDHHRIVQAVVERDALRAEQLMREHVYYAGIILKQNFERLMSAPRAADGA